MYENGTVRDTSPLPRLLTARDLEKILGSRTMAYRLFSVEGFPCVRIGKRVLVHEDAFRRWWAQHEGETVRLGKQA